MSLSQRKRAGIIANCYKRWGVYGKKVLDIGCGNGVVSEVLRKRLNLDLYGADTIDYRKVNIPFKKIEENNKLPFENLSFDYIMFNDVLHHTKYIEASLIEASRVAEILLIFEDCPSFLLNITDAALNYFYSPQMSKALNFKTKEQWYLLFSKLGFTYDIGAVSYPFWYPFRHMAFRLKGVPKSVKKAF